MAFLPVSQDNIWKIIIRLLARHLRTEEVLLCATFGVSFPSLLDILTSRNSWQKKASEGRRKMSVGGSEGSLTGEEGNDYTTYIVRADLYYTLYNLRANLYNIK